jgi:hypothetical protein
MANASVSTFPGRSLIWALVRNVNTPTEPKNIGWGDSTVTASANTNVALFKPQTESRVAGTSTMTSTSQLADTYQVTGTITCLVATKTITEAGLHDTITLSGTTTIATSSQTAGATTITLTGTIGPGSSNFYIQTENETQLVTGGQGTATFTVTRGALGSASAAHAIGVPVTVGGDGGAHANATIGGQTATVNAAAGGSMAYHSDFAGVGLAINDSIAFTWTVQLTG